MSSKCRGCGKELKWCEMPTGKKMPLDFKPLIMVQVKEGIGEMVEVYMPHWGSCEKAGQFRENRTKR